MKQKLVLFAFLLFSMLVMTAYADGAEIIHDFEHNILKAQHGERWAKEDTEIDSKLAEIRNKNGGNNTYRDRG